MELQLDDLGKQLIELLNTWDSNNDYYSTQMIQRQINRLQSIATETAIQLRNRRIAPVSSLSGTQTFHYQRRS
jgi:hypothetical protein